MTQTRETLAAARQAIEHLVARGETPTQRGVVGRLKASRKYGCSFREASEALAAWRREYLANAEGRLEAAVEAILALDQQVEFEALRRRVEHASGGTRTVIIRDRKPRR